MIMGLIYESDLRLRQTGNVYGTSLLMQCMLAILHRDITEMNQSGDSVVPIATLVGHFIFNAVAGAF